MLEARRQKRAARRQASHPYSTSTADHPNLFNETPLPHADTLETTNYRKPDMEQDTVAVWALQETIPGFPFCYLFP